MTSTRPDLRALMRSDPPSPPTSRTATGVLVPRPRSRWRTRVLVPLLVLLMTGGVLAYAARDVLRPAIAVRVTPVIPRAGGVIAVRPTTVTSETAISDQAFDDRLGPVLVQAPGWIEPAPYAVNVPVLAEGVVEGVLVLEGERVEAGQVVVRLIDTDARLQLRLAESAIAQRRADVERAKAALTTAETQVLIEQASVAELQDEVDRKGQVIASGISVGAFHRLEIRLEGLKAQAIAARQLVDEAKAAIYQAESAVAAATVSKDEAALRLERMEIRCPVAGVVLARLVEPGTRISTGSSDSGNVLMGVVMRIYDPEKLQVRVDVPLAEAAKVAVGTRAQITTEALPDITFHGVVTRAVHEANIQRNTVQFKVSVENPSPVMKPEMLTRVKLHGAATRGNTVIGSGGKSTDSEVTDGFTLLIPAAALMNVSEGKAAVWLVDASSESPIAHKREVTTAASSEAGFVEVLTGLRAADRVIIDPPPELREGSRLKVLGEGTTASTATPELTGDLR